MVLLKCSGASRPHRCPSISHRPFQHLHNTRLIQIPLVKIPDPLFFIGKVCFYSYFSWSSEIKVFATANVRHISWGEKVMYLYGYPCRSLISTIHHQATSKRNEGLLQNWAFTGVSQIYTLNYNTRSMITSLCRVLARLTWYQLFVIQVILTLR